jgi:Fe2+ or Zn2+ uptake regulation protein
LRWASVSVPATLGERVSLATVYNTLHQFKRAGLLREIAIGRMLRLSYRAFSIW